MFGVRPRRTGHHTRLASTLSLAREGVERALAGAVEAKARMTLKEE